MTSFSPAVAMAMVCIWESVTEINFPLAVEKRCAASIAMIIEPP